MSRFATEGVRPGTPTDDGSTLRRFLEEEWPRVEAEQEKSHVARDEWTRTVGRFVAQARAWLVESDPNGRLLLEVRPLTLRERGLGVYEADALTVRLGRREVEILPRARYSGGEFGPISPVYLRTFGRIDLTNGIDRYEIYRTAIEPKEEWLSIDGFDHKSEPFDRASFERAMRDLLG